MLRLSFALFAIILCSCHHPRSVHGSDLDIVLNEYILQLKVIKDKEALGSNILKQKSIKVRAVIDLILDDLKNYGQLETSVDSVVSLLNEDYRFQRKDDSCSNELWLVKEKFAERELSIIQSLDYIKKAIHCTLSNPLFCGFGMDGIQALYIADTLYLPENKTFELPLRNAKEIGCTAYGIRTNSHQGKDLYHLSITTSKARPNPYIFHYQLGRYNVITGESRMLRDSIVLYSIRTEL